MAYVIHCDCGTSVRGSNEEEIVKNAQEHAKDKHAVVVTPEQALALAQQE
jgi:predicted small metal-binding protein